MSDGVSPSILAQKDSSISPALNKILSWFEGNSDKDIKDAIKNSLEKTFSLKTTDDMSLNMIKID